MVSITKEEIECGEYLPFDVIVDREGGAARIAAREAAKNYTIACISMQGDWLSFNTMTKRMEYLYIRKSRRDVFTRHWALHNTQKSESKPKGSCAADPKQASTPQGTAQPRASVQPSTHDEEPGQVRVPTPRRGENEAKKRTSLDKTLIEAKKVRVFYEGLHGKVASMNNCIATQQAWEWAKGSQMTNRLFELVHGLEAQMTAFDVEFMTSEIQDIRTAFGEASLETQRLDMHPRLLPLLRDCDVDHKTILGIHQAMLRTCRGE